MHTHRIAKAHLDLAAEFARRRDELGYSESDITERTGISAERLDMIEIGDTTSVTELLLLVSALDASLHVGHDMNVSLEPKVIVPMRRHQNVGD